MLMSTGKLVCTRLFWIINAKSGNMAVVVLRITHTSSVSLNLFQDYSAMLIKLRIDTV